MATYPNTHNTAVRPDGARRGGDDIDVVNAYTNVTTPQDRIRWGPILAGVLTTLTTMVVLTILGLAIGASTFAPNENNEGVGTFATIWAALSGLIAFFLGGWIAGRTAAVRRPENATLNGFMVGAAVVALTLWLASTGLGNLLGGLGSSLGEVARIGTEQVQSGNVNPGQAQSAAQSAAAQAQQAAVNNYETARNSAWATLGGLMLALGAATLGGFVGHKAKTDGDTLSEAPRATVAS
jgi:hypothetical protein